MVRLSTDEMIDRIRDEKPFHAVAEDYSFTLQIREYTDLLCAAIHDGHQFRRSLWKYSLLSEYERWYEEDPSTKDFISSFPVVLAARDSRFEYDLNRDATACIYKEAWGKPVWKQALPEEERSISMAKYTGFYRTVHAIMTTLEAKHGKVLVMDLHSFNRKRYERPVPTWNLGTENIDMQRYGEVVASWRAKLEEIDLPYDIPAVAAIDEMFQGKGHFLKYITTHFSNTLVLATEIAKVYCDEETGVLFPEIIHAIQRQFPEQLRILASEFRNSSL